MRTIKFRGKRKDNGEWIHGYLITILGETHILSENDGLLASHDIDIEENFIAVNPNSVGQFTGLFDKNGKEIYEDDILQFMGDSNEIAKIFYENGCFYVRLNNYRHRLGIWKAHNVKIIGNIHDTPNLLQQ